MRARAFAQGPTLFRFAEREVERADRLHERQAFAGPLGDEHSEMIGLLELPSAAVVMCDDRSLARALGGSPSLQGPCNLRVQRLPPCDTEVASPVLRADSGAAASNTRGL